MHWVAISTLVAFSQALEIGDDDQCHKAQTHSGSSCQASVSGTFQCPSTRIIDLPDLEDELPLETKVFFIESSGRDHLLHRQACAVESALRASNIPLAVMVFTAQQLDLSHNATCHLFLGHPESRLIFRHISREKFFQDTPLQAIFEEGGLDSGPFQVVQNSDALRLLLIQKYGGWYSDLDVVFMKDTSHLRNVITGDHNQLDGEGDVIGQTVNNAVFHFDKGHPFINLCVEKFAHTFDPSVRLSGGPRTMSDALKELCGMDKSAVIHRRTFKPDRCHGVDIVKQRVLYPMGWFGVSDLVSELKSRSEWEARFIHSVTVHLFNSIAGSQKVIQKPRFYGSDVPAYLYLAERFCPISFDSVKLFRRENHNRSKNSRVAMYSALSKHASLKGRTMFNHIIFSLCVTYVSASIQGSCHITDEKCAICPKQEVIPLIHLEDVSFWSEKGIMFFIESADRTHLLPRQACSVESALKTNPNLYIIVAMTTDTLDLSSNVTCHLYSQFGERRLFFRHVDASELSQRTPLQDLFKSNLLWDSQYGIVQLSDALRLLLVQRYGGVYSDLDMIYLQSVEGLRNFISGDHNRNDYKFTMISNGIFHFSPNHTFTQEILRRFATTFNPEVRPLENWPQRNTPDE
ncbi:uncharacterized protein LOC131886592 [Tigriopus californicus]|uniref:uncharacterized protein LOC131886592 n=1 Tax=Tigriopus californicus TaxID=6832 RepID=UPI0027DA632D|nr:uncharacterized protein LOC131886592 [Tigriopus californicus]